jgi:O-antigen/teichoic acid export membrane protein
MKLYSRVSARRSLFHTAFFRTLSQFASLASYVVLVRALTEHSFGILSLLYAIIPVISTAASLGIEHTLRRFQPEYLRARQEQTAAWLFRIAASARFAANIALLGVILLLWDSIAPFFKLEPYRNEFLLFCVLILLHFQASILQISLSSHMLQGYSVGMTVVLAVAKLLAYLILLHFERLTLTNAILADTVGYLFMYAGLRIGHLRYCRLPPSDRAFRIEPGERRRLLRYSIYNNFNDAGTLLLTSKSDNFFLAALMNPVAVGAYSFYVRLNEMTAHLMPTRQFSNVIQPLFFAIPPAEASRRVPRYFTLLANITGAMQMPILAYAIAYHAELVSVVFGGKFLESSWLLPVIVGFATLNRVEGSVTLVAQYEEKASIILLSKISAIYNAAMLLVLIPVAGVYGAALATGSAQLFKNAFIWWHVRDMARWTNLRAVITTSVVIWMPCLAVCFAMKHWLAGSPVLLLIAGAAACGLALLLYLRSPALSLSDREILAAVFHGRESRLLTWLGVIRAREAK